MPSGRRAGAARLITHGAAFAIGAATAVALGAEAAPAPPAAPPPDRLGALDAFAHALSYVSTDYVEPRDERELIYGAIRGLVARLDRHSRFYGPAAYRRLREDTEGEFGGVGFELGGGDKGGHPVVERLLAGSPADRAGVRDGDLLLSIDGVDTAGRAPRQVAERLRGPRGTRVELVLRGPAGPAATRILVREQIKIPSVSHRALGRGVGYLEIGRFQESTFADCVAAIGDLRRGPGGLGALILDLRGNPGGVFDQAIKVADLFLAEGVIVSVRSRGEETERHVARRSGTLGDVPMIVLIDQSSASSAELVAGALADHRRATLLGVPSFGKGSVQTFLDLPDGSGLKLTTALYYTPGGHSLDGNGIVPDLVVEAFDDEPIVAGGRSVPASGRAGGGTPHLMKGLSREVEALVADDPQLAVALRTALRWREGSEAAQLRGVEGNSEP